MKYRICGTELNDSKTCPHCGMVHGIPLAVMVMIAVAALAFVAMLYLARVR